jgi:hypothetical protein
LITEGGNANWLVRVAASDRLQTIQVTNTNYNCHRLSVSLCLSIELRGRRDNPPSLQQSAAAGERPKDVSQYSSYFDL